MEMESENFKPSYKVLESTEKEKEKRLFPTHLSKIQEAERLKLEGNEFYRAQNYKKALSCYHKVFFMINGFLDPSNKYNEYSSKKQEAVTEEMLKSIKDLKYTTYLNMSQIYIFNKNFEKAVESATKSLEIKENVKAWFRRGSSYIELNEFEKARKDLLKVKDFEKKSGIDKNFELEQKFLVLKLKEKNADEEMKKNLKKMFL